MNPNSVNQSLRSFVLCLGVATLNAPCGVDAFGEVKQFASVSALSGQVKIVRPSGEEVAVKGAQLDETDKIETGEGSVIQVKFTDGSSITIYERSSVRIVQYKRKTAANEKGLAQSIFDVAQGKLKFFINPKAKDKSFTQFKSKTAIMGIRGTSGIIDVAPSGGTQLVVLTGIVEVKNPKFPDVSVSVLPNFATKVEAGVVPQAPKPVTKDTVQKLLPTVSSDAGFTEDGPASAPVEKKKDNQESGENKNKDTIEKEDKPETKKNDDVKKNDQDKKETLKKEPAKSGEQSQSAAGRGVDDGGAAANKTKSSPAKEPGSKDFADKKPEITNSRPLFAPGGEVLNKNPEFSSNKIIQSESSKSSILPGQNSTEKMEQKKLIENSPQGNFNQYNPQQGMGSLMNQAKEFEKASVNVTHVIEKTTESAAQKVNSTTQATTSTATSLQNSTKIKVKISLPKD